MKTILAVAVVVNDMHVGLVFLKLPFSYLNVSSETKAFNLLTFKDVFFVIQRIADTSSTNFCVST